jgi:V/A-type H+-transporting ATPase subunit D
MKPIAHNKSTLNSEKQKRQTFARFLPALELKQQQLLAERRKALDMVLIIEADIESILVTVRQQLPMLAAKNIELAGLVQVEHCRVDNENIVGVILPRLREVRLSRAGYGFLARPHWVEALADQWEAILQLRLEHKVMLKRIACLHSAVRKVTQRVNLFSKVLIPDADRNIKRIGVYMADQERAAVVRSKIAKQRHGTT